MAGAVAPYTIGAVATLPGIGIGPAFGITSAFFLLAAALIFTLPDRSGQALEASGAAGLDGQSRSRGRRDLTGIDRGQQQPHAGVATPTGKGEAALSTMSTTELLP